MEWDERDYGKLIYSFNKQGIYYTILLLFCFSGISHFSGSEVGDRKNQWSSQTICLNRGDAISMQYDYNVQLMTKTVVGFHMTSLKFKLKKLSILPRFFLHDALEQLKTNFHTKFRLKRVLGFVIEYAWISKLSRDAAFTWRSREVLCRLKKWLFGGNVAI